MFSAAKFDVFNRLYVDYMYMYVFLFLNSVSSSFVSFWIIYAIRLIVEVVKSGFYRHFDNN